MGGAEALGLVPMELDRVDRDDPLGAGRCRGLNRIDADAADAGDDHGFTRADVRDVDGRSPSGGDTAADESRRSSEMYGSIFTTENWFTVTYGENVPSRHIGMTSFLAPARGGCRRRWPAR